MSDCLAPDPRRRLCPECKKSGHEVEVLVLTTFRGDRHVVNADDSSTHVHLYSNSAWMFNHYSNDENTEISKWPKRNAVRSRHKGEHTII